MATESTGADSGVGREDILEKLQAGMDDLYLAIETAQPTTEDQEKLQLRRYHELGYMANQYRKLKRETDLAEMEERLALLEEDLDIDNG